MRTLLKKGRTRARAGLSKKVLYRACAKVGKSSFGNVQISFAGANPSSLTTYVYDPNGNRTSKVQNDDTGVILTETTTVNDLNQVTQRVVTTSSGTVTWDYNYSPDGTLASKTNGSVTTTYTFNDLQQLVQVTDTTGLNVVNTYDVYGRWLTRTDSTGTRTFEWDGMDCIGETGPEGTTRYFIPQGQIHSFSRGGLVYQAHSDALGSVRMITDSTGAVVARFDTDAFGNPQATNFDSVPGGFSYGFVGSLGVRQDEALGLLYMRARWVDPALGRFVSRDPIGTAGGFNLYAYCNSSPTNSMDPSGLICPSQCSTDAEKKLALGKYRAYRSLKLLQAYAADNPSVGGYEQELFTRYEKGWVAWYFADTTVGTAFGADAETTFAGQFPMMRFASHTIYGDQTFQYDPAFVAWVELHEGIHIWQQYKTLRGNTIGKEDLPYQIASNDVLNDIIKFSWDKSKLAKWDLSFEQWWKLGCP